MELCGVKVYRPEPVVCAAFVPSSVVTAAVVPATVVPCSNNSSNISNVCNDNSIIIMESATIYFL